jgi:FixJ family two-component response regulator
MPAAADSSTILVVDDDEGLLYLIATALRREKWTVVPASSGAAALAWLEGNRADLLLLDLTLADFTGEEFIRALSEKGRLLPFIIITGQGDARVAVDMMKRGALDYLVKDTDLLQFIPEVVWRALDRLTKEKRLAAAEEQVLLGQTIVEQGWQMLVTTAELPDPKSFTSIPFPADWLLHQEVTGQQLSFLESLTNPMPELRTRFGGDGFLGERLIHTKQADPARG